MNDETETHDFSEHHQRHVRTTFQYIDKLLSEAEHTMADAGSLSPFRRHSDDTTPIQRKVTHDYILRIREAMRRVMKELNIPPPEPHSGAVWAAAINLMYCSISLNELTPERMRAYGPLSPEAADRLDGIRAEMDGLVAKLRSYLGKGAGGDLQQRLQQLGKTGDEIRLLSEIERIVTGHGLVEFRGTLSMLLDRMESAAFEVGVFGRVSSGKSSLLNYILQTNVLPIGVTPVTAIPTRISHGSLREAIVGALERTLQAAPEAISGDSAILSNEATEALRNGDRILERAQGECFFLTRKITKMQRAIINVAAQHIGAALLESDNVDIASIFAETFTRMIAEPVAATLRSIEQKREALAKAMEIGASASGRAAPDELPKPAGMPMVDINEISKQIVIGKPAMLSLLGKGMLISHVRRKLETEYDRALLEFLNLYANRLRRWMEQSINALRNAFTAFADMHP